MEILGKDNWIFWMSILFAEVSAIVVVGFNIDPLLWCWFGSIPFYLVGFGFFFRKEVGSSVTKA